MMAYTSRQGIGPSTQFAVRLCAVAASRVPVWRISSRPRVDF